MDEAGHYPPELGASGLLGVELALQEPDSVPKFVYELAVCVLRIGGILDVTLTVGIRVRTRYAHKDRAFCVFAMGNGVAVDALADRLFANA